MRTSSRLLAAILGAAAVASVSGCSDATTAAGPPVLPVGTSSTLPPVPPPPLPTGSIGGIDAAIASEGAALLRPGGDPMPFTVTLTNTTAADIPDVRLVVSFGHCACGRPGARIMPNGSMRLLDPVTGGWAAAPYVAEGTGTDYLGQTLVPPFTLKQGQTVAYQLEARLDADPEITAGTSQLTVTLSTPDDRGHAAAISVSVEP